VLSAPLEDVAAHDRVSRALVSIVIRGPGASEESRRSCRRPRSPATGRRMEAHSHPRGWVPASHTTIGDELHTLRNRSLIVTTRGRGAFIVRRPGADTDDW